MAWGLTGASSGLRHRGARRVCLAVSRCFGQLRTRTGSHDHSPGNDHDRWLLLVRHGERVGATAQASGLSKLDAPCAWPAWPAWPTTTVAASVLCYCSLDNACWYT